MSRKKNLTYSKWNKKGLFLDTLYVIVMFMVVIITIIIMSTINTKVKDSLNDTFTANSIEYNASVGAKGSFTQLQIAYRSFNLLSVFILIAAAVLLVITGFQVRAHPIMFVLMLLINMFLFLGIPALANFYTQFTQAPLISDEATYFGIPLLFMNNLPVIFLIFTGITLVAIFGKNIFGTQEF